MPVVQIDDFPEGCERSREGAIYLRPKSTEQVTDDELAHMAKARPDVMRFVQVLEVRRPPARPKKEQKPEFKADVKKFKSSSKKEESPKDS